MTPRALSTPHDQPDSRKENMSTSIPLRHRDRARIVLSCVILPTQSKALSPTQAPKPSKRLPRKIATPARRRSIERARRFRWNACGRRSQLTLFCARAASGPVVFVSVAGFSGPPRRGATYSGCGRRLLTADETHNHEVDEAIAARKGEPAARSVAAVSSRRSTQRTHDSSASKDMANV
jgi:hypothetical protein